jgi:hypothetical protein
MKLLERQSDGLRRHHPRAGMWVSPQGFNSAWLAEWLTLVRDEPTWLAGVTYGPWTRMSLPELRRQLPAKYPIRLYPDITHSYLCQFPVPDWDSALAATLGREPINPRPLDQATILRRQLPNTFGFITYSEGCNDDVNKAVWSALGWNPNADVAGVLRDYGRYFLSPAIEDDVALGVFGLEQNWRGPLATNTEVERTLKRFQRLERDASPQLRRNWRFQQLLYRASFDAYVQKRLIRETAIEQRAMDSLREAPMHGALVAVANAEKTLATPVSEPGLLDLRTRIFQHAEALFQSIKMQLSVPLYGALATPRGANLDTVDLPLNNAGWLKKQFAGIRKLPDEKARLAAIDRVARWADAGPGGFYDDLGKLTAQPHLVAAGNYADDPEFRHSRLITYLVRTGSTFEDWRGSWWDHASAFYDSAVELRYEGLDPAAEYQVRVVYVPSFLPAEIRLEANGAYEVHAFRKADRLPVPVEFDIPTAATRDGKLQLRWTVNREAGETVGFGQVGEVWLLKK